MQATGHLVAVVVELTAGVQHGHDDLGRGDALFLVDVDRDAATVVVDRDRTVLVDRHHHIVGMAGQRLVDGVVDHLEHHVVQAGAVVHVADVHAGRLRTASRPRRTVILLESYLSFGTGVGASVALRVGCCVMRLRTPAATARNRRRDTLAIGSEAGIIAIRGLPAAPGTDGSARLDHALFHVEHRQAPRPARPEPPATRCRSRRPGRRCRSSRCRTRRWWLRSSSEARSSSATTGHSPRSAGVMLRPGPAAQTSAVSLAWPRDRASPLGMARVVDPPVRAMRAHRGEARPAGRGRAPAAGHRPATARSLRQPGWNSMLLAPSAGTRSPAIGQQARLQLFQVVPGGDGSSARRLRPVHGPRHPAGRRRRRDLSKALRCFRARA